MNPTRPARMALAAFTAAAMLGAGADTLELRGGERLEGSFRGASESSVHFETRGSLQRVPISEVAALRFDPRPDAPAPDARSSRSVIIGAGSTLVVRLPDSVRDGVGGAGEAFTGELTEALQAGELTVAPAGTPVHGFVLEAEGGVLVLAVSEIELGGERVPIRIHTHALELAAAAEPVRFSVQQPFALRVASN